MQQRPQRVLNVFLLSMINVAAILSIKNWPLTAGYGIYSIYFYLFAALFFFIPVSLVSAELATGWPQRGGIFVWVKEALGDRWAFLAIWLLWVENVVYYPTVLTFISATVAYAIYPPLANSPLYTFCIILTVFWGATLINLKGMKTSGWISSLGVILGTFIPGILIIGLGAFWIFGPKEFNFDIPKPNFFDPQQLSFLGGVILGLSGMEMSAIHAKDVKHPKKDYPKAILLSGLVIIGLSILGTLAIAAVLPTDKISLVAGGMEAISSFLTIYGFSWMIPIVSLLIAIGAFGTMSTWLVGPSRGLLAAAQAGEFPPFLHKVNKHEMPVAMMVLQAVVVTIISSLFLFIPDVSSSFWMFIILASQLYLIMYVLMFIVAIILKYKKPQVERTYQVPGGKAGMWAVSLIGIAGCLFTFFLGFFPPEQLPIKNKIFYELFLIIGILAFCIAPHIILKFKKPSWEKN